MRAPLLVLACVAAFPVEARADAWALSVDARFGGAAELSDSETERSVYVPGGSLLVGKQNGGAMLYGRLKFGFPAYYGQIGAGAGVSLETTVGKRRVDKPDPTTGARTRRRTVAFVSAEAGVAMTYFDASPEVQYDNDAIIYWGPYGRLEAGLRVLFQRGANRELGLVMSIGAELTAARYYEPMTARGRRLGVDVGLGGEVRF